MDRESVATFFEQIDFSGYDREPTDAENINSNDTELNDYGANDDDVDGSGDSKSRFRRDNRTPESEAPDLTDHGLSPTFTEPVTPAKQQRALPVSKPAKHSRKKMVTKPLAAQAFPLKPGRAKPCCKVKSVLVSLP